MNSAEAREYVRLATTETKGRTKIACDLLIDENVKLNKIKQIIERTEGILELDNYTVQQIKEILKKE